MAARSQYQASPLLSTLFFEMASLTNPESHQIKLAGQEAPGTLLPSSSPLSLWALGIKTQVFVTVQQTLYQLHHYPSPLCWLALCQLDTNQESSEEKDLQLRKCFHMINLSASKESQGNKKHFTRASASSTVLGSCLEFRL